MLRTPHCAFLAKMIMAVVYTQRDELPIAWPGVSFSDGLDEPDNLAPHLKELNSHRLWRLCPRPPLSACPLYLLNPPSERTSTTSQQPENVTALQPTQAERPRAHSRRTIPPPGPSTTMRHPALMLHVPPSVSAVLRHVGSPTCTPAPRRRWDTVPGALPHAGRTRSANRDRAQRPRAAGLPGCD